MFNVKNSIYITFLHGLNLLFWCVTQHYYKWSTSQRWQISWNESRSLFSVDVKQTSYFQFFHHCLHYCSRFWLSFSISSLLFRIPCSTKQWRAQCFCVSTKTNYQYQLIMAKISTKKLIQRKNSWKYDKYIALLSG